ncbi:hypothetical protein IJ182_01335 [bacterium]|nr:hypothetical protein [bacterium]
MKKIFIVLFFICVVCIYTLVIKYNINEENNKSIKKFLYYNDCFIDLSTYKYEEKTNTYNMNIFLPITSTGDEDKLYDNNSYLIHYLIFNVIIENGENIIEPNVKYRGFVSGYYFQQDNNIILKISKIYYENNFVYKSDINYYIEWLKENCDKKNNYKSFLQELRKINEYKQMGLIYQMPNSISKLERIIGHL